MSLIPHRRPPTRARVQSSLHLQGTIVTEACRVYDDASASATARAYGIGVGTGGLYPEVRRRWHGASDSASVRGMMKVIFLGPRRGPRGPCSAALCGLCYLP